MIWCLFGGVMISVGAGLTTTFGPNTSTAQWIGYQLMHGIGRGAALTMVSHSLSGITHSYIVLTKLAHVSP
jgi:hypothetical protein